MKRLRGPQLQMPALKVPTFVVNLWWDLWDRRLLPLVALVVAAIAAVPFLLGGGSGESPARTAAGAGPAERAGAGSSTLTVVEAKPGLRDYRKRLAGRSPADPFVQRYTASDLSGAKLNPQTEGSTGPTTVTTVTGSDSESGGGSAGSPVPAPASPPSGGGDSGGGDSPGGSQPGEGGGADEPSVTLFAAAINVKITRSGGKNAEPGQKPESRIKKRVLPLTPLPGEKAPVVTYMGFSKKGKPLLLVSTDVRSVFGEAKCISGDEVCQLIEVEPGFPETFVYGVNEVHYAVNVLKVELVVVGHS